MRRLLRAPGRRRWRLLICVALLLVSSELVADAFEPTVRLRADRATLWQQGAEEGRKNVRRLFPIAVCSRDDLPPVTLPRHDPLGRLSDSDDLPLGLVDELDPVGRRAFAWMTRSLVAPEEAHALGVRLRTLVPTPAEMPSGRRESGSPWKELVAESTWVHTRLEVGGEPQITIKGNRKTWRFLPAPGRPEHAQVIVLEPGLVELSLWRAARRYRLPLDEVHRAWHDPRTDRAVFEDPNTGRRVVVQLGSRVLLLDTEDPR